MDPDRSKLRRSLTLADLVALIGAASVGLGVAARLAPHRAGPMLIVVGPLVGIWWARVGGGSVVLGGLWGGRCYAMACQAYLFSAVSGAAGAAMRSSRVGLVLMVGVCLVYGLPMGAVARGIGAALGTKSSSPSR